MKREKEELERHPTFSFKACILHYLVFDNKKTCSAYGETAVLRFPTGNNTTRVITRYKFPFTIKGFH